MLHLGEGDHLQHERPHQRCHVDQGCAKEKDRLQDRRTARRVGLDGDDRFAANEQNRDPAGRRHRDRRVAPGDRLTDLLGVGLAAEPAAAEREEEWTDEYAAVTGTASWISEFIARDASTRSRRGSARLLDVT